MKEVALIDLLNGERYLIGEISNVEFDIHLVCKDIADIKRSEKIELKNKRKKHRELLQKKEMLKGELKRVRGMIRDYFEELMEGE